MSVSSEELARTLVRRAEREHFKSEENRAFCLRAIAQTIPELRKELGFGRVWLIGSLAWGGFGIRSDIDLVVEALPSGAALELAEKLGEGTGRCVDVLSFENLSETFQHRVLTMGRDVP